MKKAFSTTAIIVLLAMLLTGCYPTGQAPIDNSGQSTDLDNSAQSTDFQSSPIQISDKFILDLSMPDNIPDEFPTIKLTLKTWDKEEIERLFLADKEITELNERDEPFYPDEKMYFWKTEDGLDIIIQPGRFSYEDTAETGGEYQYGSVYGFVANDCALIDDCYATNGELAAFSSADADKRAREMINKLGITNLGKPRVISVRAEFANLVLPYVKDTLDKQGTEFEATPWTENEEIYILRYPQVFENTELAMVGTAYYYTDAEASSGFAIKDPGAIAVVSKDKIISLNISTIFSENYEVVENITVNCNANKSVDKFKEYLSNLVPTSTTKYYRCQPVYIAYSGTSDNMTVNFKPAWEFAGYSSHEDDGEFSELMNYLYRSQKYEYIWADTGHRYIAARD